MKRREISPYGSWASTITSDLIASATIRVGGAIPDDCDSVDGRDSVGSEILYWLEGRPTEGGRYVIVRRAADGTTVNVNPPPTNARTRVHEYGGGSVVIGNGVVVFSNYGDQQLYRAVKGGGVVKVTSEPGLRYADGRMDPRRNRIVLVREDHRGSSTQANGGEAVSAVVGVSLDDGRQQEVLVSGNDFYAAPRPSPDGKRLAWLSWNHPEMPWDGCELWVAELDHDGRCRNAQCVAGGRSESIFQPSWSPDGILTFASDRTGWWNLYRQEVDGARNLAAMPAEFGRPQWRFGAATYAYVDADTIVCYYTQDGFDALALLDVGSGTLRRLETPYSAYSSIATSGSRDQVGGRDGVRGLVYLTAASPTSPWALVALDLRSGAIEVLRRTTDVALDPSLLSIPEAITFPSTDADGRHRDAHGFYYQPRNDRYQAPTLERPPLLVISHGGPTGQSNSALSLTVQYWTSRGFAVLDVNYGGSSGYGRVYRNQLQGAWGIIDVNDCVNGADYLVQRGDVDANRLAIRGGSAGGYTTLCALTFRDTFKAGASHYGVSDLAALARDTHKFESRYLDRLVGPYPERQDLYRARSPLYNVDQLNRPVIFFQGLEDRVVPPSQAEMMVAALEEKGIPVAYLPFKGEQHGFRRAENIKRALDAELAFYGRIFDFVPAG